MVRGAYLVMVPAAWFVLVPLAHTSVLTGVALSLGTAWSLFRHYWVALKLLITVFATVILMIYMRTFSQMSNTAGDSEAALSLVRSPSPAVHSVLALVVLSAATWLGVYKPFGLTPYGVRSGTRDSDTPRVGQSDGGLGWSWSVVAVMILIAVLLVLGLLHSATGGFRH